MKPNYYKSDDGYNVYYVASTPLTNINFDAFTKSYFSLTDNIVLDTYTANEMKEFAINGFTYVRVDNAPDVKGSSDKMLLFAYDSEFKSPVGLAICFNGKFYKLGYKEGRMSESELYNIYKGIKR